MIPDRIDFENIEQKLADVLNSDTYKRLTIKVQKAKRIYICGNGGLHFTGSHAATDMTRLIPGKAVYSFESVGFISSNLNDFGGDNLFIRWLETISDKVDNSNETLIIGLSCSGNSANVINALKWGKESRYDTFMVSGVKSKKLPNDIDELIFNCTFFHTCEVITLMMFYDLIIKCGHSCPTIEAENTRKGY